MPERILVAGDWHGNTDWARKAIWAAREPLANEDDRIILHLGDFGYGPVSVTGLAADGQAGNRAVLNVRTMEWDTGRG